MYFKVIIKIILIIDYYTNNKTKLVTAKLNNADNNINVIYKCTKLNNNRSIFT